MDEERGELLESEFQAPAAEPDRGAVHGKYVRRWSRLVSSTNWEKGKIIEQWRESAVSRGVEAGQCSDEAWSQLVGDVSPQHAGRLRRTYARFGQVQADYAGLYWSHFYAALDWTDAEMWLEGAVRGGWSVSQMRRQRWTTSGGDRRAGAGEGIILEEVVSEGEYADGLGQLDLTRDIRPNSRERIDGPVYEADPRTQRPAEGLAADRPAADGGGSGGLIEAWVDLPEDLARVVDEFKLVLLRYKLGGWTEFSAEQMRQVIRGFEQLIGGPIE